MINTVYVKDGKLFHIGGAELGSILAGDDGYYCWWHDQFMPGAWNANVLHAIASLLDRMNEAWDEQVNEDVG